MATVAEDLREIVRLIPGYDPFETAAEGEWFDYEAAARAIGFVEAACTHVKGVLGGQLIHLEDWQKAVFGNLMGWKRADGTRRYRESIVFIPRGNSKTTMAAALVLLFLFCDDEPGAELYSSASEREQARLCFDIVVGMIRAQPELAARARLYKYSVVVGDKSYKALSAEAGSKHGFSPHLIVNDELHAQKTPELTEVLMTGTLKRSQPLTVHLTTSDFEREGSVCNAKHDHARKVIEGMEDPSFLPVIYEADLKDDWADPEVWKRANPNYGISVDPEYLARECMRAKEEPGYLNTFLRLHLNVRTSQQTRWLPEHRWRPSAGELGWEDLAKSLEKQKCAGGLDLSSKYDLTAFVLAFCRPDGFKLVPFFWIPEESADEWERKHRIPYSAWTRQGAIELIPGATVDYGIIEARINELRKRYEFKEIAFDPWNANATQIRLTNDGFDMLEFRQGIKSFNEPTKEFGKLVRDCKLHHGSHPVLDFCASCVEVYTDPSGNIRPVKPDEGVASKIDGIVAGIMALSRVMYDEPKRRSVYEDQGVDYY